MKKTFIISVLAMLVAGGVFGQAGVSDDDFQVKQNAQGGVTITGYTGTATQVDIPATLYGLPVTEIGEEAFENKKLTSVTIGKSVKTIRSGAFQNNQLAALVIPNGVTLIDEDTFKGNPLASITIPPSLAPWRDTEGFRNAFGKVPLTRITLPANVSDQVLREFEDGLVNFYKLQNRKAGIYVKNGPIWRTVDTTVMQVTTDTKKLKYLAKEKRYETLGLRDQPGSTARVLVRLSRGDQVAILQEGAAAAVDGMRSNWVQVEVLSGKYAGQQGWLFKGYLD